jgi:fucose permease
VLLARKIALLFASLLLWTVGMSVFRVVSDQELDATSLGVIIFVGAIIAFATFLTAYLFKITQSRIAQFLTCLLPWTAAMVFGRFITGQILNATIIGVTVSVGAIVALFMVFTLRISEKSRR